MDIGEAFNRLRLYKEGFRIIRSGAVNHNIGCKEAEKQNLIIRIEEQISQQTSGMYATRSFIPSTVIIVSKILLIFKKERIKAVAYGDDLVVMVVIRI